MKRIAAVFWVVLWLSAVACALAQPLAAEETTGMPFPDFTFTDTQGQAVNLSKLLEEKELVVISLFASWCGPCRIEFPDMEEVQARYADQLAVLGLSAYPGDSMDVMTAYKQEMNLSFPIGLEKGTGISDFIQIRAYPTNFFIDRFGNIGYVQVGAFPGADAFERTVRAFLGEDYTKTVTLSGIPEIPMDVPYPDEAELSAALNAEGSSLSFANDPEGKAFPFIPEKRGGKRAAFAGNAGLSQTNSIFSTTVNAAEGDVLSYEIAGNAGFITGILGVAVDGEDRAYYIGRHDWTACLLPLEPGEHTVTFYYLQARGETAQDPFAAVADVQLLSSNAAAKALSAQPAHPVSDTFSLHLLNENARLGALLSDGQDTGLRFAVVTDDELRFSVTATEDIDPETTLFENTSTGEILRLNELTADTDGYLYTCANTEAGSALTLYCSSNCLTSGNVLFFSCIRDEADVGSVLALFREQGFDLTWAYEDAL